VPGLTVPASPQEFNPDCHLVYRVFSLILERILQQDILLVLKQKHQI